MENLLDISHLSYSYQSVTGETSVLQDISFSIREGDFVAIVGPSGCGKSTLLSLICQLFSADEGEISLATGEKIGYMLQIDHLLQNYGLIGFKDAKPDQLSGGMRQRAALIRTLILEPDLLLLDEPFSALDYQTRLSVSDDIWKIIKKEHKTALLITHDISEAISMADRIIILSMRPAHIRCEIPVSLTCQGEKSPFTARSSPEFKTYFNQIWKELNPHE